MLGVDISDRTFAVGNAWDWAKGAVSSITSTISDAADATMHAISDIVDAIPGSDWVKGAVNTATGPVGDFMRGPFRDFARTGIGETIIRAASVSTSYAAYAVPIVGPTIAFVAWSIPGLARGEKLTEAITKEFVYRVQKVIEYFGGKLGEDAGKAVGQEVTDQFKTACEALNDWAKAQGLDIESFSKKYSYDVVAKALGIREDAAAYALAWAQGRTQQEIEALLNQFDPATGLSLRSRILTTPQQGLLQTTAAPSLKSLAYTTVQQAQAQTVRSAPVSNLHSAIFQPLSATRAQFTAPVYTAATAPHVPVAAAAPYGGLPVASPYGGGPAAFSEAPAEDGKKKWLLWGGLALGVAGLGYWLYTKK